MDIHAIHSSNKVHAPVSYNPIVEPSDARGLSLCVFLWVYNGSMDRAGQDVSGWRMKQR